MTLRIGVDIDGVMYMWEKTARYMLREILPDSPYDKSGPLGQPFSHWDYLDDHCTAEHRKWLWSEGVKLGLFRHGHLYPGTIKAIRQLAELGDVIAITHRPKSAVHDTIAWLAYQNLPLAGLHILTNQEPKSQVKPRCDVYIDDKPENVDDFLYNTEARKVALMDRPWNQNFMLWTDRAVRVSGWQQFVDVVADLKS
jgi:uncharacterized HAD superfamily protein